MAPSQPPTHLSVSSKNVAVTEQWKDLNMEPGVRLRDAGGKDIKVAKNAMKNAVKKSQLTDLKNQKFLFLFDGLVGMKDAGTVGKVFDLDMDLPRVVFEGEGEGRVEITGKKYHTKVRKTKQWQRSRFLPLLFNKATEVNVSDIFTEIVVFSSGTLSTTAAVEVTPEVKATMYRGGSEMSEVGIKGLKKGKVEGDEYQGKEGEGEEAMLEKAFGGKERRSSGRSNKSQVAYGGLDSDEEDEDEEEAGDFDVEPKKVRAPRRKSAETKVS
ncbi:hypothetical protein TL16_g13137 [Triparma laevis f. inornata]|uniref:Uncharacterized protein n=1 Tax=Triparma laevis f. inornata TaxID=1714386 RepID=A0A9W7BXB9_9STRA|nr:hypothetical protein TL16_g13137 [Triparma laevis f. inornata]